MNSVVISITILSIIILALVLFLRRAKGTDNMPVKFNYVFVEEDGSIRELTDKEIAYVSQEYHPGDGGRPYIKSSYEMLTPDGRIFGFLHRSRVPEHMTIKCAPKLQSL